MGKSLSASVLRDFLLVYFSAMQDGFVQVYSFHLPQDADVVRIRLDEEGVRYFMKHELLVQTDNFLSTAIGGIPLLVHPEDAENAKQILIESGILLEPEQRTSGMNVLDAIGLNLDNPRTRWTTVLGLVLIVAVVITLLSFILLF